MRLFGGTQRRTDPGRDEGAAGTTVAYQPSGATAAQLRRVESRLRAVAATPDEPLAELALHGIEAGGKRLRPALVVCAAMTIGGREAVSERVIDAAAAVELLHLASLYHDDVLDLYGHGLQIGKPAGSDLREGVFTLPVLMTLQRDPALVELLIEGIDEQGVDEVARRVQAVGADQRAVAHALDHLQIAFAHLGDPAFTPEGVRTLTAIGELMLEPLERLGLGVGPRPGTDVATTLSEVDAA